jgi:putative spermidine/putrescine transport system permease protein
MRITQKWALILLGPPIAFLIAFFIVPFLMVVVTSLHDKQGAWTLANYAKAVGDLYYWGTLLLTFKLSLWVTFVSLAIGYPLAYYMTNVVKNRLVRRLFYIAVVTPLFTSNIVRSFGWMVLLGRRGMVNDALLGLGLVDRPLPLLFSELSIVIGLSYIMTPFMVLTIASVLQNIDRSLEEAAQDLGASGFMTFLKVTLPLSLPGVVAGSLIVFTLSVSAYVTPSILSGGKKIVMSMLIFQQYASVFDFNFGATLAVVLLVTTIVLVAGYLLAVERGPRVSLEPAR